MTSPLASDVADYYLVERVREILDAHLGTRLDNAWGRNAQNIDDDGLRLPDLEVVYEKARPSREEFFEKHEVGAIVGMADDSSDEGIWTGGQGGDLQIRVRPVGIQILCMMGANEEQDTLQDRRLRRDENLVKRCAKYVRSTKYIMQAYLHQTGRGADDSKKERAAKFCEVTRDTVQSYQLPERIQQASNSPLDIFAAGELRLEVTQEVERPERSATP